MGFVLTNVRFLSRLPYSKTILGFFTAWLRARWLTPQIVRRGLARHDVPGFRLALIALDLRWQRQCLGGQLLAAAARRCLHAATEVGGVVLIIDAKNDRSTMVCGVWRRAFYP
jgi:hypothetical protein